MLLEAAGAEEEDVSGAAAVGGSGAAAEEAPPREQEEKQESEKEEQVEDQDPEQPARVVEMDEGGMGIEPEEEAAEGAEEAMEAAAGGGEENAEENAEEKYVEENHQDEMKAEQSASHEIVEEAEGWRLHLSSSSNTGYKGVFRKPNGRFLAQISRLASTNHIGVYDTAVQAAIAYARQVARLQDRQEAAVADARAVAGDAVEEEEEEKEEEQEREQQLNEEVVQEEDGWRLHLSPIQGRFRAVLCRRDGVEQFLGVFDTAVEAAEAYARALRLATVSTIARVQAAARSKRKGTLQAKPATSDEPVAPQCVQEEEFHAEEVVEEAEGWRLHLSSKTGTGYLNVQEPSPGRFVVHYYRRESASSGRNHYLGAFDTAVKAAICYARHVAHEQKEKEAAEKVAAEKAAPAAEALRVQMERRLAEDQQDATAAKRSASAEADVPAKRAKPPYTPEQEAAARAAEASATAEGLKLIPSDNASGFTQYANRGSNRRRADRPSTATHAFGPVLGQCQVRPGMQDATLSASTTRREVDGVLFDGRGGSLGLQPQRRKGSCGTRGRRRLGPADDRGRGDGGSRCGGACAGAV